MKKLIFNQGDETRPKFEDLTNAETYNSSIFSDIYDRAFSLIKEISNPARNVNNKHNRERNNIIAFIGERGSGKTSCLKSIYYSLDRHGKELPAPISDINISYNNQLPIIDPSYIDEQSNIIEIVIAHMFRTFKNVVDNNKHTFEGDNLTKKRDLVKKFQDVKEALDCTKSRDSKSVSNDSIEQLSKLASGSNLHDSMERLVECYLDYFKPTSDKNSQMLVIAIDDLDVQTNHTYQMVEQIRKYLIIDNVIILMGVKLVQLSDLIKKKFLGDFSDKNKELEVEDMVARYLIKLLPLSHRLNLPNYNDMPEVELAIVSYAGVDAYGDDNTKNNTDQDNKSLQESKHKQSEEIINLHETVLALIYNKTGLMFYNFNQESLIVPHNLRELLNLIALLNNMGNNKIKNRNIFRQYFVESWCLDRLEPKQYMFIKELNECDAIKINQFVVDYITIEYKDYFTNGEHDYQRYNCIPYYHMSVADVYNVLNTLSTSNRTSIKRFVFAVKTVYSMTLHCKFNEMQNIENIKFHANLVCKHLTNGVISYKSANKHSHIFDYEKMIGGCVVKTSQHISVDIAEFHSIYQTWIRIMKQSNDNNIYEYNVQKCPNCSDFNRFELYLLSTSNYIISNNLTLHYYNSFPLYEYPKAGKIELNNTAMFYNITRYCNLYKIFECVNAKINDLKHSLEELRKGITNSSSITIAEKRVYIQNIVDKIKERHCLERLELVKFFKLITFFGNNSIIYQIVTKFNSIDYSKRSAIINIEELEFLGDYISKSNMSNLTDIADIVNELANFKYYVYKSRLKPEVVDNKIIYYLSTYYEERKLCIEGILNNKIKANNNINK